VALVPASYNARSLFVRRASTVLTVVGIAATVAVLAGVLALQRGFATLFSESGREDVAVFLRPGATSEGESAFQRERAQILVKSVPEIARAEGDRPLASLETYLAVRLHKIDGGETNVPIRGVSPETFEIREIGNAFRIEEGRRFAPGADEVIVGRSLLGRIRDCGPGETLRINTTPFRVVGAFACEGPFESEIWGDVERIGEALERPVYSRVVAQLAPDVDVAALAARLENDKQVPAKVLTERAYLTSQTSQLSGVLLGLGSFLAVVMGAAAVFTGTNAMLAAISARTHEIGVLLALGFRPVAVFFAFLLEATFIGLLGGLVGALLALPLNGVRTGTTNWNTFTEVAFAFRVTPDVLGTAIVFALVLGLLGGAWPAWRAARLHPTEAFRRG
jgi:ABC-type antimicrobial peptide transport system permease subunit